jgi:hypothetical protein
MIGVHNAHDHCGPGLACELFTCKVFLLTIGVIANDTIACKIWVCNLNMLIGFSSSSCSRHLAYHFNLAQWMKLI